MSNGTEKIGGGERMTFDGVPLRDGEEEVIFENHSLSWWRQFTVQEHKENGTEPFHPGKPTMLNMAAKTIPMAMELVT